MSDSVTEHTSQLERDLMAATVFVYVFCKQTVKDEKNGGEKEVSDFRSFTATAFEREGDVYRFVTAAHCIGDDDKMCQNIMLSLPPVPIIIDLGEGNFKNKEDVFFARFVAIGQLSKGEDFAVLEAKINRELPIVPLSERDAELGEQVSNVAVPAVAGKNRILFRGYIAQISHEKFSYFLELAEISVEESYLCDIVTGDGSSGSAIISCCRQGIVALLVGSTGSYEEILANLCIALPISRFRDFWTKAKAAIEETTEQEAVK